jgi:hypothetical protein
VKLRVIAEAQLEFLDASQWYEEMRQGLGTEFLSVLGHAFGLIERFPRIATRISSKKSPVERRRFVLEGFPYAVIYEVRAEEVVVLAVAHTRRRPGYWKRRTGQ